MSVDSGRGFVEFRLAFVSLHVTSNCLVSALQDFGIYFNPRLVQRFEDRFRGWWARFDRDDVGVAICLRIRRAPERLRPFPDNLDPRPYGTVFTVSASASLRSLHAPIWHVRDWRAVVFKCQLLINGQQ